MFCGFFFVKHLHSATVMKLLLRLLFTIILLVSGLSLFAWFYWYKPKLNHKVNRNNTSANITVDATEKIILSKKANLIRQYVTGKGYNQQVCFLVNMGIESGKNRFFVYRLDKDSIINSGLVTHGNCNSNWLAGKKFGNNIGCGCTALGKYKVGDSYSGKFGLAFKLYGLDSTNSNALKRFVVLHSHSCVPESEVSPLPICQSLGCPTVSLNYLKYLQNIIDKSDRPILLWIFDE